MEFSHDKIRAAQDRSWTLRLLGELQHANANEQVAILRTLSELADPRALEPLRALLANDAADSKLRYACAQALRDVPVCASDVEIAAWWASGDAVHEEHALLLMHRGHEALLAGVLAQPSHRHFRAAIATLVFGFEAPRFQAWKVAALGHMDADVRACAASVLHWDEPICATEALIECLRDPELRVAAEAARTLTYYPALAVVRALADHPHAQAAQASLRHLREDFEQALVDAASDAARAHLAHWMQDAWISFGGPRAAAASAEATPDDLAAPQSEPAAASARKRPQYTSAQLMAWLSEPDGAWAGKLYSFHQRADVTDALAHVSALVGYFLAHVDAGVREAGCQLLAELGQVSALRSLMHDPVFLVRKSAVYAMGLMAPEESLAEPLSRHLSQPSTTTTHAYETLVSYVRHAEPAAAIARLSQLVRTDNREAVRCHAVHLLAKLSAHSGALTALEQLLPLLQEPPQVTWLVHLALLDAARAFGWSAPATHLLAVDNLHVQIALARLLDR